MAGVVAVGAIIVAQPQQKPTVTEAISKPARSDQRQPSPMPKMAVPVSFHVPALDIEAPIEQVGLTKEGDMDVPVSETALGWYQNSAYPGNPGPSVLAGHTGLPNKPSPFRKLEQLQKGSELQIKDVSGTIALFTVTEITAYTPEKAPRERIFGSTTASQLAIITCSGTWSPSANTYTHRLVIYAHRVPPPA